MEKHHSPDNGIETGGIASMGDGVIVGTSEGVGSVVGVAPQLSEIIRDINVMQRARQRYRISLVINFFQRLPAAKGSVHLCG